MAATKKELNEVLKRYSKIIEPAMANLLCSGVDKKNAELVKYQALTAGKRLRPFLALTTCRLLGGKIQDAVYPAAGLEILHNYSLIIDDIIDNGLIRRNKPTAWAKFGKSMAECIGVDYACAIFQAANKSKNPVKISGLFAKTLKIIVDGEILDILFERSGRSKEPYIVKNRYDIISEKDYFEMTRKKTAALFQTSCECGGILAGATPRQTEALRKYGKNLGMAFQIQDDILDIFGKVESFGKKIGKDIMERKGGNIVIMLALKELPLPDRRKVLSVMEKENVRDYEIKRIINLVLKTNGLKEAQGLGERFVKTARESLNPLPKNKWNDILKELADFMIKRRA
jgi:geranylgeranyl diphosphate synthase, type I